MSTPDMSGSMWPALERLQGGIKQGELFALMGGFHTPVNGYKSDVYGHLLRQEYMRRAQHNWRMTQEIERLFGPRPLPTHYITPFDMKGKPMVVKPRRERSRINVDYEHGDALIYIDSLAEFRTMSFSSSVKDTYDSWVLGEKDDPWAKFRPRKGGYYD